MAGGETSGEHEETGRNHEVIDDTSVLLARLRSQADMDVHELSTSGEQEASEFVSDTDIARAQEGDTTQSIGPIIVAGEHTFGLVSLHRITHSTGFVWENIEGVPTRREVPNQGSDMADVLIELGKEGQAPRVLQLLPDDEMVNTGDEAGASFAVTKMLNGARIDNLDNPLADRKEVWWINESSVTEALEEHKRMIESRRWK